MAYTNEDQVLLRAPAITPDARASAQVAAGIAVATSRINGRLAEKYLVPFVDPVPELIQVVATTLAASWAMRNVFSGSEHVEQIEFAQQLETEGKALLNEIYSGDLRLEDATTNQTVSGRTPPIHISNTPSSQLRCMDLLGYYGPKIPNNHWNNYYPNYRWPCQ